MTFFCSRFENCGANICPLDADWERRSHLTGEPVCVFMREVVKPDGLKFKEGERGYIEMQAALAVINDVREKWPNVDSQLAASVRVGSRFKRDRKASERMKGKRRK